MQSHIKKFDFIVIGSGMAGISIATELSKECSVCILEKEKLTSYHSTGRSFAFYLESYGNEIIRKLTSASKDFFLENSQKESLNPILKKRGVAHIATKRQYDKLQATYNELTKINQNLILLSPDEINKLIPCLNKNYADCAIYDAEASDIDVDALYNIYLKEFKKNKGTIITNCKINKLIQENNYWVTSTQNEKIFSEQIINASGAWCDEVALQANAKPINIIPKKRTVYCFKPTNVAVKDNWPLVVDIEERFYFKIENNIVLASPADETPTQPHDAQPDDLDIAIGAERIKEATNFEFKSIINKWAGLRNFVGDKSPVIGYDQQVKNFFWLAGQGGYGIQTAPSLAKISSNIILNKSNVFYENNYNINLDSLNIKRLQ